MKFFTPNSMPKNWQWQGCSHLAHPWTGDTRNRQQNWAPSSPSLHSRSNPVIEGFAFCWKCQTPLLSHFIYPPPQPVVPLGVRCSKEIGPLILSPYCWSWSVPCRSLLLLMQMLFPQAVSEHILLYAHICLETAVTSFAKKAELKKQHPKNLYSIKFICKVTLSFTPDPLFQWYMQS
jgi:hypothetical protein